MKLRPKQVEQRNAVEDKWAEGHRSVLMVSPTGTGKTVVLADIVANQRFKRTLVIAHREELITQLEVALRRVGCDVGVEMAERTARTRGFVEPQVVVASVQTLVAGDCNRLKSLVDKPDRWGLTVIDEAHHAIADSYRIVLEHMQQNVQHRVLGVTATPDRTDRLAMGAVFEAVAHEYAIGEAIEDGYLVPIKQRAIMVESLDYSKCRTTAGDLNGRDLARVMELERNLHAIAEPTMELAGNRKAVVFCASVDQARRITEIFNRAKPHSARFVEGNTPKDERRQIFREFDRGDFQFLCNCMIATEGWDCPSCEVVVLGRPTKSRSLFVQCVGRGTRPLPGVVDAATDASERRAAIAASEKTHCEIFDFVGNSGRHKLVNIFDVLGGEHPGPILRRAQQIAAESDEAVDIDEAIELAREQERAEQEKLELEAQAKRARLRAKVKHSSRMFNPFDVLDIAPPKQTKGEAASDKQVALLAKFKIDATEMSKAEASRLTREVFRRMNAGYCTVAQARILKEHGYSTEVSVAEASKIIDGIFKRGRR